MVQGHDDVLSKPTSVQGHEVIPFPSLHPGFYEKPFCPGGGLVDSRPVTILHKGRTWYLPPYRHPPRRSLGFFGT